MNIVIGMPILDKVEGETMVSLINLMNYKSRNIRFIPTVGCSIIHDARNHIIEEAYKGDFDAILFIDSDMVFEPDTLERLIHNDKDVCGVLYQSRTNGLQNVFSLCNYSEKFDRLKLSKNSGIVSVGAVGAGILFIKKVVLDKVRSPWFFYESGVGEDCNFCKLAGLAGFNVYVDTDLEVGHIGKRIWRVK
jgi:glycosyltransferase involved in cell wall biosynthesis